MDKYFYGRLLLVIGLQLLIFGSARSAWVWYLGCALTGISAGLGW